ncbi:hypothetical protein J6590_062194 [Homalodisca vitripennis]|nr:hypothetical protein J6590_062194 [Homalodisca vitripennis]
MGLTVAWGEMGITQLLSITGRVSISHVDTFESPNLNPTLSIAYSQSMDVAREGVQGIVLNKETCQKLFKEQNGALIFVHYGKYQLSRATPKSSPGYVAGPTSGVLDNPAIGSPVKKAVASLEIRICLSPCCFDWRIWYIAGLPFFLEDTTEINVQNLPSRIKKGDGYYLQPFVSIISCHWILASTHRAF